LLEKRGGPQANPPSADDLEATDEFLGPGYGHRTPKSESARALAAEAGVELDPTYTAKALAALLARNADGAFGRGPVLFLNTYDQLSTNRPPV
jgi:D-cysteine desulfhydrase